MLKIHLIQKLQNVLAAWPHTCAYIKASTLSLLFDHYTVFVPLQFQRGWGCPLISEPCLYGNLWLLPEFYLKYAK